MLTRNKVLLYKVETTKGTDAVPVVGTDLIRPNGDVTINVPTDVDSGEGELKGTYGPGNPITLKQSMSLDVTSRVRGLGGSTATTGAKPDIHPFLIASGHKVVLTGDGTTTVPTATYTPTSVAATIQNLGATGYFFEDGLRYRLLGANNTLSFEAAMNVLTAKMKMQAGYAVPTVVANPVPGADTKEIFRMTSALCTVTEAAAAINIGSFSLDCGVEVAESYETGKHEFLVTGRNPILTIDPRAVATAADWNALTNATSFAVVATFTNSLGEELKFNIPKAVLTELTSGDRAGRITRPRKFSLVETAGDDQYSIIWTGIL